MSIPVKLPRLAGGGRHSNGKTTQSLSARPAQSTIEALVIVAAASLVLLGLFSLVGNEKSGSTTTILGRTRELVCRAIEGGNGSKDQSGADMNDDSLSDYDEPQRVPRRPAPASRRSPPTINKGGPDSRSPNSGAGPLASKPSPTPTNAITPVPTTTAPSTSGPTGGSPTANQGTPATAPPLVPVAADGTPQPTASPSPPATPVVIAPGQRIPDSGESDAIGGVTTYDPLATPRSLGLIKNTNDDIVFKDEEGDGSDYYMTANLNAKMNELAKLVSAEWPGAKLRVTEAWSQNAEHGVQDRSGRLIPEGERRSAHYSGRAVDITVSDLDPTKLGRLGALAREAGFDWVFYEDSKHIHASVK